MIAAALAFAFGEEDPKLYKVAEFFVGFLVVADGLHIVEFAVGAV